MAGAKFTTTAHASAAATDKIPALKSTTKGYHTPVTLAAYVLSAKPYFIATKNGSAQTGLVDVTWTQITFGTEQADNGSYFATNAWTPAAGPVRLKGQVTFTTGVVAGAACACAIYKDGVIFRQGAPSQAIIAGECETAVDCLDVASGSNVYTLYGLVDTAGGTAAVSGSTALTWFEGHQL